MENLPNTYDLSAEQHDTAILLEQLLGKTVADRYIDFCRLSSGTFSLRVSRPIAAHALRELESIIRVVLAVPMGANPPEEIDKEMRKIVRKSLAEHDFAAEAVNRALVALEPRINHKDQILKIVENLGFASDGDIAKSWLSLQSLFGKAHKRSFHHSLSVDDEFRTQYQQPFESVIRSIVIALQSRYSTLMLRVEAITAMQDKTEAIKYYKNEIPGALPLQWHFFSNIQTPDWLPLLAKEGLLGEPIADLDQSSNNVLLRQWPAGNYLLRMAQSSDSSTRKLVIEAIRNIASSTHPEVQQNGLEILAVLPPDESAPHVEVALAWLNRDADFFRQQVHCNNLVTNLAEGGQSLVALRVARELLQLWDQDGQITCLYDNQMYAYYLPEFVKVLTKACGEDALRLFCDLLEQAASISGQLRYDHFSSQPISDDEMADTDVYYALKRAVRQSAEILVHENAASMHGIVTLLADYDPTFFLRLALHILAKNPNAASDLVENYLTTHDLIEADWCSHEYAELALAWYPSLTLERQQEILRVVDALPDKYRAAWKVRFEERNKMQPTEDEEQEFNAGIFMEAVWKWRTVLPAERQETLSKIEEMQGSPDTRWARFVPIEESPLTEVDFSNRPIVEIVAFLKSWHPGEKPRKQTITALAQKLRHVAERDAKRYGAEADQFSEVAPIYVRHLLEGIKNSVGSGRDIIHENVLKLIQRTFSRIHEPVNDSSVAEGDDPNWLWSCTAGAELLKDGLGKGENGISYQYVDLVQTLVFGLLEHAPQQPELKDFEDRFQRDSYFGSAATLRGAAIELCILFTFWLSKHQESTISSTPQDALENMPNIRSALEKQLEDISPDGRIPRAILGRYLCFIVYSGKDWLKANIDKIFPSTDGILSHAALHAHIGHDQRPIKELMPELLKFYEDDIACLANSGHDGNHKHYQERLANYLILLHIWDVLPDKMLEHFWHVSSVSLRQYAMWCLGNILGEQLSVKHRTRGYLYWERRLEAAKSSSQPDSFREEIGAIGQWNLHDKIDRQWLSDQLLAMLKAGFGPKNEFGVVEWLAKTSQKDAIRAVVVLEALLKSQHVNLMICMTQKVSIRTILTNGLTNGTVETISRSRALISFLSSNGETSYLDLVHQQINP